MWRRLLKKGFDLRDQQGQLSPNPFSSLATLVSNPLKCVNKLIKTTQKDEIDKLNLVLLHYNLFIQRQGFQKEIYCRLKIQLPSYQIR